MEAIIVALIVAVGAMFGQYLLKRQDYRRQDEVAARVAKVATQVKVTAAETNTKLDEVHKIVNQQRTDMRTYQELLVRTLSAHGVDVPKDESLP